jgi:hypothetical protein
MVTLRHPLELLRNFQEEYRESTPKIIPKMSKRIFQDIKEQFNYDLEEMKALFDESVEAYNVTPGSEKHQKLQTQFQRTQRRILMSYLSPEFQRKYEDELRNLTGPSELLTLLGEIIGEVSDADLIKDAQEKLRDISRNSEEEETFVRFTGRITQLAEVASKKVKVLQEFFIDEAFNRSLTPEIKRYLLDQGMTGKTTEETAKYLDKMKKHRRKPNVNVISTRDLVFQEQIDELSAQFASFPDIIRESLTSSISSIVQQQIRYLQPETSAINKIAAKPSPRQEETPRRDDRPQPRRPQESEYRSNRQDQQGYQENRYPDHFQFAPDGKPYRCTKCGVLGHESRRCRGTTLTCRYCGEAGHIKFACPKKMAKN